MFSGRGGLDGGLQIQSTAATIVTLSSVLTVAAEIRTVPGRGGYVFAKTSADGAARYWSLYLSSSTKEARVYATVADSNGVAIRKVLRFKADLTDGALHKVLLLRDQDAVWMIVDGKQVGAIQSLGGANGYTLTDCGGAGPDCVTYLGQRASSTGGGAYRYAGFIERLQMFNSVLSAHP